jgi:hypothetical protein
MAQGLAKLITFSNATYKRDFLCIQHIGWSIWHIIQTTALVSMLSLHYVVYEGYCLYSDRLWAGWSGSMPCSVQTGSPAHPAPPPPQSIAFQGLSPRNGRDLKLTTYPHPVPTSGLVELYLHSRIHLPRQSLSKVTALLTILWHDIDAMW